MRLSPPWIFMPCTRGLVSPAGVHIGIALASTWQLAQRGCVTTASIRFHASNPSARLTLPGGSASLTISSLAATIPVRAAIDEAAITTAIRELFMARPSHEIDELVEGHFADPLSGRREDCVGKRGRGGRNGRFADASHFGIVLESANLDEWTLIDPHGFVVVVVGLLHRALCVSEFAVDGVAEPPDHPSLHLVLEIDGIDDLADVDSDPDLVDPDALVRRRDFDDFGRRRPERFHERDAPAFAVAERSLPIRHLRERLQQLAVGRNRAHLDARLQ